MKKDGSVSKIVAVMCCILIASIIIEYFAVKNDKNKNTEGETTTTTSSDIKVITEEEKQPEKNKTTENSSEESSESTSESTSEKKSYTDVKVDGVTYINGIMIVNKTYALPSDYNPGVNPEAQSALNEMFSSASNEGVSLWVQSGFRSYSYQKQLYENYAAQDGKAAADRYSARPGHSEHQMGLAFDLNSLSTSFGDTAEGKWLANNCWKYGFIIRYPQGSESITGYMYEPWHVRYLGKDTAKAVYDSGLTLEEYLGVNSQYSY